jgi:hypothetical protein
MAARAWLFVFLTPALPAHPAAAQQREPAIETYVLSGAYLHGNLSIAALWKPQWGGGVLLPVGSKWAGLIDVTTSLVTAYWKHDGAPGATPDDNFSRERRIVLSPSFVRLWRRERFSVYGGGGLGFEHERQQSRIRPIVARDEQGRPVVGPVYVDYRANRTDATLVLRMGTVVSLSPRIVVRGDFALLPRYMDERASKSLAIGVGYRF